jgi:hypothetical protein
METNKSDGVQFDEQKSLQIIKEMIEVSQKRLNINGILFIIWGWLLFIGNLVSYIEQKIVILYPINKVLDYCGISMLIFALAYSIYFFIKQNNKVRTYIDLSLRYVWVSMLCSLVLINLIQGNVVHEINFELQHPIFMVVIALATVISGGILRYKMLIFGGIFFGAMALISSYFALPEQLLLESVAWLIAFIFPGHYLYAKRKNR